MSDNPPRRWHQFHLLTLLVVVSAMGPLWWGHMSERVFESPVSDRRDVDRNLGIVIRSRGWPFTFKEIDEWHVFEVKLRDGDVEISRNEVKEEMSISTCWNWGAMIGNLAVALAILAALGIGTEALVRWRERRQAGG